MHFPLLNCVSLSRKTIYSWEKHKNWKIMELFTKLFFHITFMPAASFLILFQLILLYIRFFLYSSYLGLFLHSKLSIATSLIKSTFGFWNKSLSFLSEISNFCWFSYYIIIWGILSDCSRYSYELSGLYRIRNLSLKVCMNFLSYEGRKGVIAYMLEFMVEFWKSVNFLNVVWMCFSLLIIIYWKKLLQ